jgi:hypothetical protein
MVLSVIVTTYWVLGLKIDNNGKLETFTFNLPFPAFRDSNKEQYWKEVLERIYTVSGASKDTEIYAATQEEYLIGSGFFEKTARISDLLASNKLPLVYLGETRGSVKGVVTPLVINPVDFYRWFYLAQNINQVENYFFNRRAYGVNKPSGAWEQGFEESLLREKLTYLFENSSKEFFKTTKDLVLSGEGLIYAGDSKRVVLSFLDAAIPGFWRVYTDNNAALLNLECIKVFNPEAYKKYSEELKLRDLAGCLVVPGAERLELTEPSGNTLNINLKEDSISVVPFDRKNTVQAKIFSGKENYFVEVSGGDMGLVIDNRVRPLLHDKSSKKRISLIDKWVKEISSKVDLKNVSGDKNVVEQNNKRELSNVAKTATALHIEDKTTNQHNDQQNIKIDQKSDSEKLPTKEVYKTSTEPKEDSKKALSDDIQKPKNASNTAKEKQETDKKESKVEKATKADTQEKRKDLPIKEGKHGKPTEQHVTKDQVLKDLKKANSQKPVKKQVASEQIDTQQFDGSKLVSDQEQLPVIDKSTLTSAADIVKQKDARDDPTVSKSSTSINVEQSKGNELAVGYNNNQEDTHEIKMHPNAQKNADPLSSEGGEDELAKMVEEELSKPLANVADASSEKQEDSKEKEQKDNLNLNKTRPQEKVL